MIIWHRYLTILKKIDFNINLMQKFLLTHFSPVSHFYTPWKRQKIKGFLTFSGGKKCDTGLKWGNL